MGVESSPAVEMLSKSLDWLGISAELHVYMGGCALDFVEVFPSACFLNRNDDYFPTFTKLLAF